LLQGVFGKNRSPCRLIDGLTHSGAFRSLGSVEAKSASALQQ
jgi:hypothetical protein